MFLMIKINKLIGRFIINIMIGFITSILRPILMSIAL